MSDDGGSAVPIKPLGWALPPAPISSDRIHIEREIGKDGRCVTHYKDALGNEVGIQPQQHHQGLAGHFDPPPVQAAVLEAEAILAEAESET